MKTDVNCWYCQNPIQLDFHEIDDENGKYISECPSCGKILTVTVKLMAETSPLASDMLLLCSKCVWKGKREDAEIVSEGEYRVLHCPKCHGVLSVNFDAMGVK